MSSEELRHILKCLDWGCLRFECEQDLSEFNFAIRAVRAHRNKAEAYALYIQYAPEGSPVPVL